MNTVIISEVAPRDGLQSIGAFVPTETKIAMVQALYDAGIRHMEVGSFVSPKHVPQMADTAAVLAYAQGLEGLAATVLVPNRKGFELAMAHGARHIGLFMSVTESHNQANVRRSREDSFAELASIVRDVPSDVGVRFNLSCCFHCPFEGVVPESLPLEWAARAHALNGEMEISLADTTGNAAPDQVGRVFRQVIARHTNPFAFHGHDTYGMGVANAAAAYEAGCRVFDGAAGGLGGCPFAPGATGNTATEDLAWMFQRMGVQTGIRWEALLRAADLAAKVPGGTPGGHMRVVPAARESVGT